MIIIEFDIEKKVFNQFQKVKQMYELLRLLFYCLNLFSVQIYEYFYDNQTPSRKNVGWGPISFTF